MKNRILCGCAVFAFTLATTSAQTKNSFSGKCTKPDVQQSLPAGDADGHNFSIDRTKCSAKGNVNGAVLRDGVATEHRDNTAKHSKAWGVYVQTFEGDDRVFYNYQESVTVKSDGTSSGTNRYQISGGTGKMKGIKGTGTCELTGTADGGTDYSCTGEYTVSEAAPAKN